MPRQYFFWKYFNTIIVLYCIIVQKNPIFVQLSPIQCTYSNIFIRFFKFFPANTNIYQNSYRVIGANCAVEIALSGRQCSLLCLFAPFPHASTKVSCGVPDSCAFEITLLQAIMLTLLFVCAFFSASYASFLTRQSSQATTVCLTLAYSFSQRVHSIPLGPIIKYLAWVL